MRRAVGDGERRRRGFRRDASGQALTEFALVAPLLVLLIAGMVEFSRAWHAQQVLTDAAREALRGAVVDDPGMSEDSVHAVVRHALTRAALDPDRAEVAVSGWRTGRGTPARIRVSYRYRFGVVGSLLGTIGRDGEVTLSTSFVMRNE